MNTHFGNRYVGYSTAEVVTPSDTGEFLATSAVHLGTGGTLRVLMAKANDAGSRDVTIVGLAAGWHLLHVTRIFATGTVTVANITIVR